MLPDATPRVDGEADVSAPIGSPLRCQRLRGQQVDAIEVSGHAGVDQRQIMRSARRDMRPSSWRVLRCHGFGKAQRQLLVTADRERFNLFASHSCNAKTKHDSTGNSLTGPGTDRQLGSSMLNKAI